MAIFYHKKESFKSAVKPSIAAPSTSPFQSATSSPANQSLAVSPCRPIQRKNQQEAAISTANIQPLEKANNTGLPNRLKFNIERLSGLSMNDVKVHYNSSKPAKVGALAYTQGTEIHVGSNQERHLPHEAWHVVQQMQKRVNSTLQMKSGGVINDEVSLEKEADVMGAKALRMQENDAIYSPIPLKQAAINSQVIQRTVDTKNLGGYVLTPEKNVDIISHILNTDPDLKGVYSLPPELETYIGKAADVSTQKVDRAKKAEATINPGGNPGARGKAMGQYNRIRALGNWERIASNIAIVDKAIDTGHLIADRFFEQADKATAYEAGNLAPQQYNLNEGAYQHLTEDVIESNAQVAPPKPPKGGAKPKKAPKKALKKAPIVLPPAVPIKLEVELDYQPDIMQFPIKTLVDREALVVNSAKQTEHNNNIMANKIVSVKRRLPTSWKATITPVPPYSLSTQSPNIATSAYSVNNYNTIPIMNQGIFNSKIPFSIEELSNNTAKIEHLYRQDHENSDPKGIKTIPHILNDHLNATRSSSDQKEGAKKLVINAKKTDLMHKISNTLDLFKKKRRNNLKKPTIRERLTNYAITLLGGAVESKWDDTWVKKTHHKLQNLILDFLPNQSWLTLGNNLVKSLEDADGNMDVADKQFFEDEIKKVLEEVKGDNTLTSNMDTI